MKHFILPSQESPAAPAFPRFQTCGFSLGGVFYDYLCRSDGTLAGVRYHVMDEDDFGDHPVYKQFLADRRFSFCPGEHVDMVFEYGDAESLHQGHLSLRVVQDFGGERILECDGKFGLAFDIPDGWHQRDGG